MRHSFVLLTLLIATALAVSACNNSGATPTSALASVILTTSPSPPTSGNIELTATVKDASGQPLDGAEVFVFGNHTEMTGMTTNGKATAQGAGRYTLRANFGMAGTWKVTVQVKKPPLDVTQSFNLEFK